MPNSNGDKHSFHSFPPVKRKRKIGSFVLFCGKFSCSLSYPHHPPSSSSQSSQSSSSLSLCALPLRNNSPFCGWRVFFHLLLLLVFLSFFFILSVARVFLCHHRREKPLLSTPSTIFFLFFSTRDVYECDQRPATHLYCYLHWKHVTDIHIHNIY